MNNKLIIILVFILSTGFYLTFFKTNNHIISIKDEKILPDFFNDKEEIERMLEEKRLQDLKDLHIEIPSEGSKSVYMTSLVAGNKKARDRIIKIIEETEINSLIIDIKEVDGYIAYNIGDKETFPYQKNLMPDIREFIKELHEKNIYVIGRLVLFKDKVWAENHPEHAVLRKDNPNLVWADYGGKKFIDPGAKEFWNYLYKITAKSYEIGFDEINFDYIRYPSDGNMSNAYYQHSLDNNESKVMTEDIRVKTLTGFMENITDRLRAKYPEIKLSADVFGMVTTNADDLTIGQKLEPFLANFDYVAPMVYPSHYPSWFLGLDHPDLYPYEVVYHSQKKAQERLERLIFLKENIDKLENDLKEISEQESKIEIIKKLESYKNDLSKKTYMKNVDNIKFGILRPWIQDFTCTWCNKHVYYGPEQIQAQIKAGKDAGQNGWMVWNPTNRYLKEDFLKN